MTYTVWAYAHEEALHHRNELADDTVDDFKKAMKLARQRAAETEHNTGFAKIVDNGLVGASERGVVAIFTKAHNGSVRRSYLRGQYRLLLRREKFTREGLRAFFNPALRLWEYFESVGRGGANLRQTGSTLQFQY